MADGGYSGQKEQRRKQVARDLEWIRGQIEHAEMVLPQLRSRLQALEDLVAGREPPSDEGGAEDDEGVTE